MSGPADSEVTETLSPALPTAIEERALAVLRVLCEREWRVAVAESCTGGLLASLLTDVDGCSHAFERGFVAYSNAAKTELLGVPPAMLEAHGPVSEAVARAMAEGALARADAHLAVAVTGFAGRGGPDDPPGRVHFALARRGGGVTHVRRDFGDVGRGPVRIACLDQALRMVQDALRADPA